MFTVESFICSMTDLMAFVTIQAEGQSGKRPGRPPEGLGQRLAPRIRSPACPTRTK